MSKRNKKNSPNQLVETVVRTEVEVSIPVRAKIELTVTGPRKASVENAVKNWARQFSRQRASKAEVTDTEVVEITDVDGGSERDIQSAVESALDNPGVHLVGRRLEIGKSVEVPEDERKTARMRRWR